MTAGPARPAQKAERMYHFAAHFLFYVIFPISLFAFIIALKNPEGPTHGIAGQPMNINHWIVLLVFLTMTVATGYGMVKSIIRDVRYLRQRRLRNDSSLRR